jgi:hypothetical protein
MEGAGRTLAILTELDLHEVETTNIDQSQSVVITVAVVHGDICVMLQSRKSCTRGRGTSEPFVTSPYAHMWQMRRRSRTGVDRSSFGLSYFLA